MKMGEIHINYIHYLCMSHSHCTFIPRNVLKGIKLIIIGNVVHLLEKFYTVLNISNKVLLTMQEKGILLKSHGKMSEKQSDYIVK